MRNLPGSLKIHCIYSIHTVYLIWYLLFMGVIQSNIWFKCLKRLRNSKRFIYKRIYITYIVFDTLLTYIAATVFKQIILDLLAFIYWILFILYGFPHMKTFIFFFKYIFLSFISETSATCSFELSAYGFSDPGYSSEGRARISIGSELYVFDWESPYSAGRGITTVIPNAAYCSVLVNTIVLLFFFAFF